MRLRKPSIDATMLFLAPAVGYGIVFLAGTNIFSPPLNMVYLPVLLASAFWIIHRYLNPAPEGHTRSALDLRPDDGWGGVSFVPGGIAP